MTKNAQVDAVIDEVERAGFKPTVRKTRRSQIVEWKVGNHLCRVSCAISANGFRATLNARAHARREMRNAGGGCDHAHR